MLTRYEQGTNEKNRKLSDNGLYVQRHSKSNSWATERILQSIKDFIPSGSLLDTAFFILISYTTMNVPQLLKTLRMRDKQLAEKLNIKVAQLNRRQKEIQQPNEENKKQLIDHVVWLIAELQRLIQNTGTRTKEAEPVDQLTTDLSTDTQQTLQEAQEIPDQETQPQPTKKLHWKTAEKLAKQAQQSTE